MRPGSLFTRPVLAGLAALLLLAVPSLAPAQQAAPGTKVATFAGGCFWCMEAPFDQIEGVSATISGYMGGKTVKPTYEQVSSGTTGHTEVVQVTYDPSKVTYEKLVEVFWRNIDPLDASGQFCDKGSQYRTGIFFHDAEQQRIALASKKGLEASGRFKQPIVTEITAAGDFTAAEDYHQDFYKKNPRRYYSYRTGCGRDARLEALWGKADKK